MALPGYTAELSIYKSTESYSMGGTAAVAGAHVVEPAQSACHRQCFRRICGWWGRKCDLAERNTAMEYCDGIC